jgi:hypothetical protein
MVRNFRKKYPSSRVNTFNRPEKRTAAADAIPMTDLRPRSSKHACGWYWFCWWFSIESRMTVNKNPSGGEISYWTRVFLGHYGTYIFSLLSVATGHACIPFASAKNVCDKLKYVTLSMRARSIHPKYGYVDPACFYSSPIWTGSTLAGISTSKLLK